MSSRILAGAAALVAVSVLSACGTMSQAPAFDQASLPDAVKVPAGNVVSMETVGVGEITYECRDKKDAAGQTEWVFVGPKAVLNDRSGKAVGTYYGPPATWEANDGSKFTGTQVAISPASAGNIPLQLVKANPATGNGAMTDVTFVQRVATVGGVAPKSECSTATKGTKEIVKYQADYILYKAAK
ncbi:uncharacterized protein DUF3455 [Limnobacter thiooxidans]|uniref:DUF3455 domain-containing protein n=1 Tax=Limnobacter thiooxidans TaxID=131080 RepID=A0AA86IX20_9BURK|nr:DUF3455 domain-containing protein [Limnobacter sp.]MCZ8016442.1 DUF3455 domain-containing protein [Limnobacter sp.]RZS39695.1 uncharacterized protein DUF3455 [Limnobacter thiooxidans]BET24677.1 DUF3455 domain-containing protein [Limnobacter thiooxidans]